MRGGNVSEPTAKVDQVFSKYDHICHHQSSFSIPDLTGRDLELSCKAAKPTAPSLNDWSTAEFKLLPTPVFDLFAMLLNRVEHEGKWPRNLCFAKAAFLYKEGPENAGPLDLRTLLILPTIYRRGASSS